MRLRLIDDPLLKVITLRSLSHPIELFATLYGELESDIVNKYDEIMQRPDIPEVLDMLDISFSVENFPHDVAMQARTHRIGVTFDVQSQRYSGLRVIDVANSKRLLTDVFYIRPAGQYLDRKGKKYTYTAEDREIEKEEIMRACHRYAELMAKGCAEEHARMVIPQSIRQNFVLTTTYRALFHFLNLRLKHDAQIEIQTCAYMMLRELAMIAPRLAEWYTNNLQGKAILAP